MKVIVYRRNMFWRVKLVAANGEILMVSETYYSRSNAVRAAQRLRSCWGPTRLISKVVTMKPCAMTQPTKLSRYARR